MQFYSLSLSLFILTYILLLLYFYTHYFYIKKILYLYIYLYVKDFKFSLLYIQYKIYCMYIAVNRITIAHLGNCCIADNCCHVSCIDFLFSSFNNDWTNFRLHTENPLIFEILSRSMFTLPYVEFNPSI